MSQMPDRPQEAFGVLRESAAEEVRRLIPATAASVPHLHDGWLGSSQGTVQKNSPGLMECLDGALTI